MNRKPVTSRRARDLESMIDGLELKGIDDSKESDITWRRSSSLTSTVSAPSPNRGNSPAAVQRRGSTSGSTSTNPKKRKPLKRRKSFTLGL